jgi:hypothetical protein
MLQQKSMRKLIDELRVKIIDTLNLEDVTPDDMINLWGEN